MSMDFDGAWLGFMRAMRLARRKPYQRKEKGRTPYLACGLFYFNGAKISATPRGR
jgi:hypothetical protein